MNMKIMKIKRVLLITVITLVFSMTFSCGPRQESILNEAGIILTPAPSQNVRINGAKILV
jgi:hypothetical protein